MPGKKSKNKLIYRRNRGAAAVCKVVRVLALTPIPCPGMLVAAWRLCHKFRTSLQSTKFAVDEGSVARKSQIHVVGEV